MEVKNNRYLLLDDYRQIGFIDTMRKQNKT